ncbi:MAG: hypothetical protein PVG65_02705 [Candidatus Thorarchaeota archaeon]|jgi:hypothetical protein
MKKYGNLVPTFTKRHNFDGTKDILQVALDSFFRSIYAPSRVYTIRRATINGVLILSYTYIDIHELKNPSKYYTIKLKHMTDEETIELVEKLQKMFERGRVLVKYIKAKNRKVFGVVPEAISKNLNYRQVKRILSLENKNSYCPIKNHEAIKNASPSLIGLYGDSIDLGDYQLESWNRRVLNKYSYITFNEVTSNWVDKIAGI